MYGGWWGGGGGGLKRSEIAYNYVCGCFTAVGTSLHRFGEKKKKKKKRFLV